MRQGIFSSLYTVPLITPSTTPTAMQPMMRPGSPIVFPREPPIIAAMIIADAQLRSNIPIALVKHIAYPRVVGIIA